MHRLVDLAQIQSCLDVTDEHIQRALAAARSLSEASPRERCIALLKRMVDVAAPESGAPRMLMLFAQMAKRDWLDGDLVVRMIGDQELAVLELLVDDGTSRERIVGPLRIDVPLAEFTNAFQRDATRLLPLRPLEVTPRGLTLVGTREAYAQGRKASISALSVDFARQIGKPGAKPPPRRPPPPPRKKSLASLEKAPAVLEMPDDLETRDDDKRK